MGSRSTRGARGFEIDPRDKRVLTEWLFLETCRDLDQRLGRLEELSRYETLGFAPILRKLLIDGTCLVDRVRQSRREVPLVFEVEPWTFHPTMHPPGEEPIAAGAGMNIVPGFDPGSRITPVALTMKHFLSMPVARSHNPTTDITVRQTVKYYANTEGAVHLGDPQNHAEQALMRMAPYALIDVRGHAGWMQLGILAALGQVTLTALRPLIEDVRTNSPELSGFAVLSFSPAPWRAPGSG